MRPRGALLAIAIAACAPEIATPAEQQRAADRADADRIAGAIAALPGVAAAHAALARDGATAPRAAVVIVATADADVVDLGAAGRALAGVAGIPAPRVDVTIARTPATAALAQVGPFTVAASSATPLRATLVVLMLAIAAAAGVVAAGQRRRGNRPQ
jgi:hypothetical protein